MHRHGRGAGHGRGQTHAHGRKRGWARMWAVKYTRVNMNEHGRGRRLARARQFAHIFKDARQRKLTRGHPRANNDA
eukprot:11174890-Lingulodinium_polyedra.AAC.1